MELVQNENTRYLDIVKNKLHKLGDEIVTEDVGILAQYVVTRFLKTSPIVFENTKQDIIEFELDKFVSDIYSMLVTFVYIVNSLPINNDGEIQ